MPSRLSSDRYIGPQTRMALENFPFGGRTLGDEPAFVRAFAKVKAAASIANCELGALNRQQSDAICRAAAEMMAGSLSDSLRVPLLEGSGGTSLNMNVNEVLASFANANASRANRDGRRALHPNDHVNRSQSTNDVVPSAMKLAFWEMLDTLDRELKRLQSLFECRSAEFSDIVKLGRTCLRDAQPMMLGSAFQAYGSLVNRLRRNLQRLRREQLEIPLGATAIGTGFGAPQGFGPVACAALSKHFATPARNSADPYDALSNADTYARLSGELKSGAGALAKIAADFILLSSGPVGGIGELILPEVQPGSSIMPGKVNPVIPMAVCQISYVILGHDVTISTACQHGQLEINAYEPLIAAQTFESIRLLTTAVSLFADKCVAGIIPDRARMEQIVLRSASIATMLAAKQGYDSAAALVRESERDAQPLNELLIAEGILNRDSADSLVRESARGGRTPAGSRRHARR